MKKLLFVSFLLAAVNLFAQNVSETEKVAKFTASKHSFGKIKQGTPVTYVFKFKNTGNKPLIVESALAGCGCTTPEYTKKPIAKGAEGTIKVTFNAATLGVFTKDVNVKFLNFEAPIVLNISGEVIVDATKKKKP